MHGDVDTMHDEPDGAETDLLHSDQINTLSSYSSKPLTQAPFKPYLKPLNQSEKSYSDKGIVKVCDGVLLRDTCKLGDACKFNHDAPNVNIARKKLANLWLSSRSDTFNFLRESHLFEGMQEDEFNHVIDMLDEGELPLAMDPHIDQERLNFLESVCDVRNHN